MDESLGYLIYLAARNLMFTDVRRGFVNKGSPDAVSLLLAVLILKLPEEKSMLMSGGGSNFRSSARNMDDNGAVS